MLTSKTQWQLPADLFDSPHLRSLFEGIPSDKRLLTLESNEPLTATEQRLTLSAPGMEWLLPIVGGTLTDIRLICREVQSETGVFYVLEQLEGNLSITESGISVAVTGTETNHGELVLTTTSRQFFPASFVTSFVSGDTISSLIGTSEMWQAHYRVIITSMDGVLQASHQLEVDIHLPAVPLLSEHIKTCNLLLLKRPDQPGIQTHSWLGKGTVLLDQEYILELTPTLHQGIEVVIFASESGFPGPAMITELLGLDTLSDTLNTAIQQLPFADNFKLHTVSFEIHPKQKNSFSGRLHGSTSIDGHDVFFALGFPDFHLMAELNTDTPIQLNRMIDQYLPNGSGLSDDLRISRLETAMVFDPLSLSLHAAIDSIWETHIGSTPITFDQLSMSTRIQSGKDPQLYVRANWHLGKVDLAISAQNDDGSANKGWLFSTNVAHETGISLRELIDELADLFHFTTPETFPDISLRNINLSFHTRTHAFKLHAEAHLETAFGPLQKGDLELTVQLDKDSGSNKHSFQLELNGTTTIEQAELRFRASIASGGWSVHFDWAKREGEGLHLTHLLSAIAPNFDAASIPPEVERILTLSMVAVSFDSSTKEFSGELRTEGGQELFISGRGGEGGGLLAGLGYHQPEDIPHFGEHLQAVENSIALTDLWLVINTFGKDKQLPSLPDVLPHAISKDLQDKKLALLATLDMENGATHPGLAEVAKQSPHSQLTIIGAVLNDGISIKADLMGDITLPLQQQKGEEKENQLQLEDSYLEFSVRKTGFNFELGASMQFVIDHMPLHPSLRLSISEKSLRTAGRIQFGDEQHKGWSPFGLKGIELEEIAILLGVEFATAALEFGLFGKVRIDAVEPGKTGNRFDFGIILELHGEIPNIQYFALSIQEIDFTQLIKAVFFNGANAPAIHTTLKGEDLSIYMAESKIKLPDGTETNPGFGLHGLVTLFDWKAYAHLDAHPDSGIRGHLQLSPIISDWFELTGNSEDVVVNGYYDPDTNNWVTRRNAGEDVPKGAVITTKTLVEKGGPVLHLDTTASPYLAASAHVKLLHFLTTDLDIQVSDELLDFNIHFEIEHLVDFRLHCSLRNGKELYANGQFFAGIDIAFDSPFGPVEPELGIRAAMELHIGPKPKDFKLVLKGSIDFMGADIDIAQLDISGFPERIEELPSWLGMQFTKDVIPPLYELFKNGYDELHEQTEVFDQAAFNHAQELLQRTREWAKFVDDDIREMQQEQGVSFLNAQKAAARLNEQSTLIEQQSKDLVSNMRHQRLAELDHLHQLKHLMGDHSENQLERIQLQIEVQLDNLQREIHDLLDADETIRTAIHALWEQTKVTDFDALAPAEQSEAIIRQRKEVEQLLGQLTLTLPEEKDALYPEQAGKFLPRAVHHHAVLIAQDRVSTVQAAAILAQAEAQVAVILNRAQQDVQSIHKLHTNGN